MQEKHLFEYAIIRIMPKVEREEFINTGVILFSKKQKFLNVLYKVDKDRLKALCCDVDADEIEEHLSSFERICKGSADGGPIAKLDLPSRFRWLTATRSTVVQTSKVHPGFCTDLQVALEKLFHQMVP